MRFDQDQTGLVATLDVRVLLFACTITILVGIICRTRACMARLTRGPLRDGASAFDEGFGTQRVQGILVIMQMSLGVAIIAGAGLLSKNSCASVTSRRVLTRPACT